MPLTWIWSVAPAARIGTLQVSTVQPEPVTVRPDTAGSSGSAMSTRRASDGPLLVTEMVHDAVPPGTNDAVSATFVTVNVESVTTGVDEKALATALPVVTEVASAWLASTDPR